MWGEDFFGKKGNNRFSYALLHSMFILLLFVLLVVTIALTWACSRIDGPGGDSGGSGELVMSFAREEGASGVVAGNGLASLKAYSREMPDTNDFLLTVQNNEGSFIYNGKYSQRPGKMVLAPGSYNVRVVSSLFDGPGFDSPCYADSATVLVEGGEVTRLSFLCRMSNGAIRLGFTAAFKERFGRYTAKLEDCNGTSTYPYQESRFLYLAPGDVFLRMVSVSDSFLISRKVLKPTEMVTLNLHSSVPGDGSGGTPPGDDSNFFTGILIDTASVWLSEELVVGERRDGSSRELALTVDEIAGFAGEKGVWVSGYIAGFLTTGSLVCVPPFGTETNIALASVPGEMERSNCCGVSLPAGEIRVAVNLKDNPGNLGKKLWVKGSISASYFGLPGVSSVTDYYLE